MRFDPFGSYWPAEAMHFGSHIFIGRGAHIAASAGFYVGNYVLIGPEFCVMGGDHNFGEVGRLMWDVDVGGVNLPVVVEGDVWMGARVTLLKGVRMGCGSVVGAGSVVTKSVLSTAWPPAPLSCPPAAFLRRGSEGTPDGPGSRFSGHVRDRRRRPYRAREAQPGLRSTERFRYSP